MTDYSAVVASEIDADSPITVSLITKLANNHLAQGEGAAGAPKIANDAFAANSIGFDKIDFDSGAPALGTATTIHISTTSSWVIPAGMWMISVTTTTGTPDCRLDVNDGTSWDNGTNAPWGGGLVVSDGTNVRLTTTAAGEVDVTRRHVL